MLKRQEQVALADAFNKRFGRPGGAPPVPQEHAQNDHSSPLIQVLKRQEQVALTDAFNKRFGRPGDAPAVPPPVLQSMAILPTAAFTPGSTATATQDFAARFR